MDGIFNVLKPPGMTSHDVVGAMRKILQMKKIGHAGTLDPMAAGVLPVFTGQATRFLEYAAHDRKTYRAELTFGFRTDTGDLEGKVLAESPVRDLDLAELKETLQSFVGEGMQVPPMYSAISVGGKKLYKLARQGIVVEREPRPITIHELSLLTYRKKTLLFEVTCSKGTFIRTLCEDIAKKLAMEGTMSFLLRTKVGDFTLENAHTLEEIQQDPYGTALSLDVVLRHFPHREVNDIQARRIAQGVATTVRGIEEGQLYVIERNGHEVIGLARAKQGRLCPHKIIYIPE